MARATKKSNRRRSTRSGGSEGSARRSAGRGRVRYAVVGLGYIAQTAVLPAFAHARRNSELVALVSGDDRKGKTLARKYGVDQVYSYSEYGDCLASGEVDAVYIALPNNMHHAYSVAAAEAGVHVLCEKPMAVTVRECEEMIRAAEGNNVKLMIAYRLHFEEANLKAMELVRSRKIGDARSFSSVFTMTVKEGDIRLEEELGGGTLYDIGIYCINAARYLFADEPTEVFAYSVSRDVERFAEVDEMTTAVLRFPNDRLASFTSSFGASSVSSYHVVGTKGDLRVDPAYSFSVSLKHHLTINDKTKERTFPKRDQFAPLLIAFSNSIQKNTKPSPSGQEGLTDVAIIEALYESARNGKPVSVGPFDIPRRPSPRQEIRRPAVKEPELVAARPPRDED